MSKAAKAIMPELHNTGRFAGLVPTLNEMGFMTAGLDPLSQDFVEHSKSVAGPILEIGAAYGVATLEVLENRKHITANDLDERHLRILEEKTKPELRQYLTLLPGAFPDGVSVEKNHYSAALACRVFHFFEPETLVRALKTLHECLVPGGLAFIVADTPYMQYSRNSGMERDFQERLANGTKWPGFFDDVHKRMPYTIGKLPAKMHLFDSITLSRALEEAQFTIEKAGMFDRPELPEIMRSQGNEGVGVIARKPLAK